MTNLFDIWQDKHPGGDYAAGVRLLQEAGWGGLTPKIQQDLLAAMITGVWTPHLKGKVESGLKRCRAPKIMEELNATEQIQPTTTPDRPVATPLSPPAEGGKLSSPTAIKLHKEHSYLHALMVAAKNDRERGRLAKKIMEEIIPALDREYDRLRAGASLPADTEPSAETPAMTAVDMIKRQNSLRARTSRLRNHMIPNAPNLARKQELEAELSVKEKELNNLTALLANATA